MEEKLKKLLDNYYGDCRSDDHKQEIIEFITSEADLLIDVLAEETGKYHIS